MDIDQKTQLEEAIIEAKAFLDKEVLNRRSYILIATVFSVLLLIHYLHLYPFPIWFVLAFWVFAVLFFLAALGTDGTKERALYERLFLRKELMFGLTKSDSHFDSLVNINIENLAEYYRLVKIHTQKSFNASLFVAVFGFVLIAVGLILAFSFEKYEKLSYISTASGIIIEFISASFFYLYSKTVQQLKGYHDSLIEVQNMLLSFRLIDATEEQESKVKLIEKMMDYLASKK